MTDGTSAALRIDIHTDGSVIAVHAQPGARREGIAGVHGDALKCCVRARATDGRANKAILGLLARTLDVPTRDLELTAGATSRAKRVLVRGLPTTELRARLAHALLGGNG